MHQLKRITVFLLLFMLSTVSRAQLDSTTPRVRTANGILEGINKSGVKVFEGVPFAAPPVGNLRWKEPQPVVNWEGVRKASKFGPRPMQNNVFGDMNFRSDSMSEDCLYLNIWTPAKTGEEKLPVLVYFYGGGLIAGAGCEPRYAGESMARRGIISITANYRLGIFGFFAYPELTQESPHHSSGNYGYLDQNAALKWVKQNIAAFGGDPGRITIAGESAGSISVSAQMCSPLSKGLIAGAIGSSGSLMGALPSVSLSEGEKNGVGTAGTLGAHSLKELRAIPANKLLSAKGHFAGTVDGYFMPEAPDKIYEKGQQSQVPLLVGWNSQEMTYPYLMKGMKPTLENLTKVVAELFGNKADQVLKLYHAADDASAIQAANHLASDLFIAFSTWKWSDVQARTGGQPVFRYLYCHPRPVMVASLKDKVAGLAGGVQDARNASPVPRDKGAVHSADIEYAMGNLPTNRVYDWQPEDYEISEVFQSYYLNFVKTGDPNGLGLIQWTEVTGRDVAPVLQIDLNTFVKRDPDLEKRYKFLDDFYFSKK